jgi:hypothetical protein
LGVLFGAFFPSIQLASEPGKREIPRRANRRRQIIEKQRGNAIFLPPGRWKEGLFEDAETDDPDHDQIDRHDVVEQARHDQDEDAGNECHDGLKLADADGHLENSQASLSDGPAEA